MLSGGAHLEAADLASGAVNPGAVGPKQTQQTKCLNLFN
jgi:hypothetical protein